MIERVTDPDVGELINGEPWTEMDRIVWRAMHHVTQNRFERAQDIAAAVAAHMESPEVIERMAIALCIDEGWLWESVPPTTDAWRPDDFHFRGIRSVGPFQEDFRNRARAAIRAAVQGGEGG